MMQFTCLQTRPLQPTYGAIRGGFSFVITMTESGKFHASAKRLGGRILDGTRQELGHFARFNDAVHACEKFQAWDA